MPTSLIQSIPDAMEAVAALSAVLLLANLEGFLHLASTPDMLLPNLACAEVPILDVPDRLSTGASNVQHASTPDRLLPSLACAETPTLLDVPGRLSSEASFVEMQLVLLLVVPSLLSQKLLAVLRVLPLGVLVGVTGRPVKRAVCCSFCCSRYSSLHLTKHRSGILAASETSFGDPCSTCDAVQGSLQHMEIHFGIPAAHETAFRDPSSR